MSELCVFVLMAKQHLLILLFCFLKASHRTQSTHKDHKKVDNEVEGPDVRPIMGATVGPNVALTNFIAIEIVKKVAEEASVGNDCKSTEELLNKFEEYNRTRIQNGFASKNVIIASMDINKWYPSMKTRPMTKEIKQMIIDSKIEFKEIDYDKISKYLGEHMTIEEILEDEMEELLYIHEHKMDNLKKAKEEKETNGNKVEDLDTEKRGGKSVNTKGKKKTNKENTLDAMDGGTSNVTTVNEDEKGNKAHKKRVSKPLYIEKRKPK